MRPISGEIPSACPHDRWAGTRAAMAQRTKPRTIFRTGLYLAFAGYLKAWKTIFHSRVTGSLWRKLRGDYALIVDIEL